MSQASASPVTLSAAPPLGAKLGTQLSIMMFLQYAIWGAWLPILYPFLFDYRGFTPEQIGTMFAVGAIGALLAPFIAGQIADRYFNTEKFLGISHIIGGVLIWQLSNVATLSGFLLFSLIYSLVYSPTLPLTNSLAFHHIPDRDRDFGRVRVWGTIGWIAAGIAVGQWLSHRHTINEEAATKALVQEHVVDEKGRAAFSQRVEVTLKDYTPATIVSVGPEGPSQQVQITMTKKPANAGKTYVGTVYEKTSDVIVLNVNKEGGVELQPIKMSEVATQRPWMESMVRPERLEEVKLAVTGGKGDDLFKYSQYSLVTVRGGDAEIGKDAEVELKSGERVTGTLLAQTDKVLVIEKAGDPKTVAAYLPADVANVRKTLGDPVIGTIAKEQPDKDALAVTKLDGTNAFIRQKDIVKTEPYSVFNAATVAKKMNDTQAAGRADAFKLSGLLGIVMGLFCFLLPSTPPSPGKQTSATAEAWGEVKRQPLITLFLLAVPISCIHQFYFVHTSSFGAYQNKAEGFMSVMNTIFGKGGGGFMTIGQMSEIAVLAFIPLVAKRWSRKSLLTMGIIAYGLRMFLFAYVDALPIPPVVTIILGVALHGFCFGCFIFVAFMIVDEETTGDVRASAQSLFNLVIVGIGIIVGSMIAGWVATAASASGTMNYRQLFTFPMWAAAICLVILLAFYPGGKTVPKHPD